MPSKKPQSKSFKTKNFLADGLNLPELEEKVLEFWKNNRVLERSLNLRKGKKNFVFYEGPPGANGRPGTHHILSRIYKDIICRFQTMRGFYVPRKSGWDTHGLPVEIAAEKELGLKSKREIESFGIAEFNRKCKDLVWKYKEEWEKFTSRIGFWLDLKDSYVTYSSEYIESLWWIVKQVSEKGLLYKGYKIVQWCTRCGTGLSSHELALGYRETVDRSVYLKFKLLPQQKIGDWYVDDNTYVLSWTTTPWTLPGNVALAVGENISYEIIKTENIVVILAKELVQKVEVKGDVLKEIKGKDLVGLKYKPLFDVPGLNTETSHQIYPADFVTTTDGTGVVHTAVMYGEDDYQLGVKVGLPQKHTVSEEGLFVEEVPDLAGLPVKKKETEDKIFAHLEAGGNLLKIENYTHEYPHCWRCDTPLLYYARDSWFISMSKLRKDLLANNKKINWVPDHIKNGRFGEWLREVKDWNFTRERYWGTPFPVWECDTCKQFDAIGSFAELEKKTGVAKNHYWTLRHGESETNLFRIIDSGQGTYHLTAKGKKQAEKSAENLKKILTKKGQKLDLIVASPITRTRETADIVEKVLKTKVVYDERLSEIKLGELSGSTDANYHAQFPSYESKFQGAPKGGETLRDLRKRMWKAIESLEKKYSGKNILVVSHEYSIWMLEHATLGTSEEKAISEKIKRGADYINTGELNELPVRKLPRNESGELDVHRPYVDEFSYNCSCGGKMKRVASVIDVWYDSGAMPFAQAHYPFENREAVDKKLYPAEYICEAVDQTRGWFYTLLAVSTLLGRGTSFKNVICLGHINDKHGKKMSKSKGNVIDPWDLMTKHGIDAVRWYFYTNTPVGEYINFDEQEIVKSFRRFHSLIFNSYVFYSTYGLKSNNPKVTPSKNILDEWILTRLEETSVKVASELDHYHIREAALKLEELADDLSRWYIRRSRRRFQSAHREAKGNLDKDFIAASATLARVLNELTLLIAPFTPFFAEGLYGSLSNGTGSVHLRDWPKTKKTTNSKLIKDMAELRRLASLGLAKRAEVGIKVRQPLVVMKVKSENKSLAKNKSLLAILKDEVNVKEIIFDPKLKSDVWLDQKITPALKEEGILRDLTRAIQELRQKADCSPKDKITLWLELPANMFAVAEKNTALLAKDVNAKEILFARSDKFTAESETKIDESSIWLGLRRL